MHASSCGNVERAILYAEKALQITSQQQPNGMDPIQYIITFSTDPQCRCRC